MRFEDDDEELNKDQSETGEEEEEITLSFLQTRFVEEYFNCNGNKMEAAKRAGYSASSDERFAVVGRNLYKNRSVRKAIDRVWRKSSTPRDTFERLVEFSKSSMEDFIEVDDEGNWKFDLSKAKDRDALKFIQEIEVDKNGNTKVKLYSSFESLKIIAKVQNLLEDKIRVQIELENVMRNLSPETREQVMRELSGMVNERALPSAYVIEENE